MRKLALITGASSGIGYATALAFAKNGIDLILCGRNEVKLNNLVEIINNKVKTKILVFEVADENSVKSYINSLSGSWQEIDILINNAGNAHGFSTLEVGDTNDWNLMIDINIKGLLYVSKYVIPFLIKKGQGHIVNISSIAGKETYQNGVVYCATKSAVEKISEGMRLELTEFGIKVSNIAPGAVETEFSNVRFKGDFKRAAQVYQGFEPLQANDIADVILYAVKAPEHVNLADITILPAAQASATKINRKN